MGGFADKVPSAHLQQLRRFRKVHKDGPAFVLSNIVRADLEEAVKTDITSLLQLLPVCQWAARKELTVCAGGLERVDIVLNILPG